MSALFPDLLRCIVTDVMLVLLLCTMAKPKYKSKWIYLLAIIAIITLNLGADAYFYVQGNYNAVLLVDLSMLLVIGIALKPLFSDKIMQWCFSYITLLNIYAAVVFFSYILCDYFPHPSYAHVGLRFFWFSVVIVLFRKKLTSNYRQVVDHWHVYFLAALALFFNYIAYFLGGDIEENLTNNRLPLLMLLVLSVCLYSAILHSLGSITKHYAMREENLSLHNAQQLLRQSALSMEQRLALMDESTRRLRISNHDRRHFNNTLLELLTQKQTEAAIAMLQQENSARTLSTPRYCENPAINGAVSYYASLAEKENVDCQIHLEIPAQMDIDSLELCMVLSNLLENAILACQALPVEESRWIRFTALYTGQLIVEMENPYTGTITLDNEGYPTAIQKGHGLGTQSVLAFVNRCGGQAIYRTSDGLFQVRLLV